MGYEVRMLVASASKESDKNSTYDILYDSEDGLCVLETTRN